MPGLDPATHGNPQHESAPRYKNCRFRPGGDTLWLRPLAPATPPGQRRNLCLPAVFRDPGSCAGQLDFPPCENRAPPRDLLL